MRLPRNDPIPGLDLTESEGTTPSSPSHRHEHFDQRKLHPGQLRLPAELPHGPHPSPLMIRCGSNKKNSGEPTAWCVSKVEWVRLGWNPTSTSEGGSSELDRPVTTRIIIPQLEASCAYTKSESRVDVRACFMLSGNGTFFPALDLK